VNTIPGNLPSTCMKYERYTGAIINIVLAVTVIARMFKCGEKLAKNLYK